MASKMIHIPVFESYDASKDNYECYFARPEQHFRSCHISGCDDKKCRLISWVGSETYSLLQKIRPGFENDCSYEEIKDLVLTTKIKENKSYEQVRSIRESMNLTSKTMKRSKPQILRSRSIRYKQFVNLLIYKNGNRAGNVLLSTTAKRVVTFQLPLEDAVPFFAKSRNIPHSLLDNVKTESDRLVSKGKIVKVNMSDWVIPIVVVPRPDGRICLCADFRDGLNSKLLTEQLPFGVSSAPALFQRYLESILVDIDDCAVYLDDIIISRSSVENHMATLHKVLKRLEVNGLAFKIDKCQFFEKNFVSLFSSNKRFPELSAYWQFPMKETDIPKTAFNLGPGHGIFEFSVMPFGLCRAHSIFHLDDIILFSRDTESHFIHVEEQQIDFLGHIVSSEGIRIDPNRNKCIIDISTTTNINELRNFLRFCSYEQKFIKTEAFLALQLFKLMKKIKIFLEGSMRSGFAEPKRKTLSFTALIDGEQLQINFANQKLNSNESNYSATDKEILAIEMMDWKRRDDSLTLFSASIESMSIPRERDEKGFVNKNKRRLVFSEFRARGLAKTIPEIDGDHYGSENRSTLYGETTFGNQNYPRLKHSLQPIKVKEVFSDWHVFDGPLLEMSPRNRYFIIFVDRLTQWIKELRLVDQRAESAARTFVDKIVWRFVLAKSIHPD
ncbi:hypothetical protein RF11_15334 [Thelohanellus kitauei]|uniref:Reverse transcriptase domain-containing protein n=1 Tax=Thelohanellus kitauei TaxID=669202 RepID=A0A0C2ITZ0_THEKT|nr:hypothetical protein RF11_15334 [Thelohanellus kitauei]